MKIEITNLKLAVAFVAILTSAACFAQSTPEPDVAGDLKLVVYHDANCGCCGKWMAHMRENGFAIESVTKSNINDVKQKLGVPQPLRACHTAIVNGYVIEGHVPATDVLRLLKERPDASGLSVPGMPMGSPGMEYDGRRQAYDVVLFDEAGKTQVFTHYPALLE
ncbi:MAG: DUF411 domain-containing protein [Gammaproteobacteria bacterium]|jgi:hypothetical protein|nr:DUF411 domain-containing protein [Gammaproteobacteria bacterium]